MVTVYRQTTPLTESQIENLIIGYCLRYRADMVKYELWIVFRECGESNYHMYKCLCKYREEIIEDEKNFFRCQMLWEANNELIKDISNILFFQKLGLKTIEGKVDKKGSLRSKYCNDYIIDCKVYR